MGLKGI